MNTKDIKALGHRLQRARKSRGLTQQHLAEALEISRTTVTAIENGERKVKRDELMEMARLFGQNVSDLVGDRESLPGFAVQFKVPISRIETDRKALEGAVQHFQRLCESYLYLEKLTELPMPQAYAALYSMNVLSPEDNAEDTAFVERNRLGLGDGPIGSLREILENDVGLRIFFIELPPHISGIYGYIDELGGCIAINSAHPEERRRLSLAHEYAHFLTERYTPEISTVSNFKRRSSSEQFADSFASSFLMSERGLRHRFNNAHRTRNGQVTATDIYNLSRYYFVSLETLSLKLEKMRLLPKGTWNRLREQGFNGREAQRLLGFNPRPAVDHKLPLRYQLLAMEAYMKGDLTEGQLSSLMEVDRLMTRKLAQELTGVSHMSEAGELTGLSLDLAESLGDVDL